MRMKFDMDINFQDAFLNEEYEKCIDTYKDEIKEDKENLVDAYYTLASIIASNSIK